MLDGIGPALPSTLEAYELGVRASEAGFDWAKAGDLLDKIEEEVHELRRELSHDAGGGVGGESRQPPARGSSRPNQTEEEVGDLLFAVANLARFLRLDPESCLRRANQKFKRRFQALEREVERLGKRVHECREEELDQVWNKVKAQE